MNLPSTLPLGGTESTATSATSAFSSPATSDLGKDEFLQLLVTQLSNQDPLNPLEGHDFIAQLAQFSSLESLINIQDTMNSEIEMNSLLAQSMNTGIAAGLVGQTITADGDVVSLSEGEPVDLSYDLAGEASSIEVIIRDENGRSVRTLTLDAQEAGSQLASWDGQDDFGADLPSGTYSFEINATDVVGTAVEATPQVRGKVDRVTYGPEGILLWVGSVSVDMAYVTSIQDSE